MLPFVQKQMPATDAEALMGKLQLHHQNLKEFYVGLSDKQTTGLRTMAEGREGYARLISDICVTHVENLARDEDPAELQAVLAYYSTLSRLRLNVTKMLEMVDDTQTATGYDAMRLVDRYAKQLHARRESNVALDLAMREVDAWNSRFGPKGAGSEEQDETPPPAN